MSVQDIIENHKVLFELCKKLQKSNRNCCDINLRFIFDREILFEISSSNVRDSNIYPFIKAYRVESDLVMLVETEGEMDFHKVRIYDRDRTIRDVLRNMNKMDRESFNKAVQKYVEDSKKTYRT